jgi:hypothetical protein
MGKNTDVEWRIFYQVISTKVAFKIMRFTAMVFDLFIKVYITGRMEQDIKVASWMILCMEMDSGSLQKEIIIKENFTIIKSKVGVFTHGKMGEHIKDNLLMGIVKTQK